MAVGAGPRNGEKSLLIADLSTSPAGRALGLFGPRGDPRAAAFRAGFRPAAADLFLHPGARLLQADLELQNQVSSPLRIGPPAAAPASEDISKPEQAAQDILEIPENGSVESRKAREPLAPQPVKTEAVIGRPLFRIPQHALGLAGFHQHLPHILVAGGAPRGGPDLALLVQSRPCDAG